MQGLKKIFRNSHSVLESREPRLSNGWKPVMREEILLQWKENLAALRDFVRVFDGIELLLKRLRAGWVSTGRCDQQMQSGV